LLAAPSRAVVALDFDGTLAPIVPDPAEARAHPEALPVLARLAPRLDSIVILTGRPALVAAEYAGALGADGRPAADAPAGLVILGLYGLERWDAATGTLRAPTPAPGVAVVRERLPALLDELGVSAAIEDKVSSVAVHTRRSPDPAAAFAALREPLAELAAANDLIVEPGRQVIELRAPGIDKGKALRDYVAERDARMVLFAGDDLGDLPAFDAVAALRDEGVAGLTVYSASAEQQALAERADMVVPGPEGVVTLLRALDAALTGPAGAPAVP
jgi:trehalose 6-phosphate phosphatase